MNVRIVYTDSRVRTYMGAGKLGLGKPGSGKVGR